MRYEWNTIDIENELRGGQFVKKYKYTTTLDLTDLIVKMQVRKSNNDEEVILEFISTGDTMLVDTVEKTISLYQPASVMQEVIGGEYTYDIKVYTDETDSIFIQKGKFKVLDSTTR